MDIYDILNYVLYFVPNESLYSYSLLNKTCYKLCKSIIFRNRLKKQTINSYCKLSKIYVDYGIKSCFNDALRYNNIMMLRYILENNKTEIFIKETYDYFYFVNNISFELIEVFVKYLYDKQEN